MDVSYVIKHKLEDFVVEEVSVPVHGEGGQHAYAVLRKSGMTTAEALQRIAEHWGLDPLRVVAAGLKDEDGITSQTISIQHDFTDPLRIEDGPDRWLTVSAPFCRADTAQVKGALLGNNFWVTVRRVDPALVKAYHAAAEGRPFVNHYFINYFDRQRFGLPGSNYRTPAVGAAIGAGDDGEAARLLLDDVTAILDSGQDLPRNHRQFFDAVREGTPPAQALSQIDPRSRAFFVSSHYSLLWNTEVSDHLAAADRVRLYEEPAHPLHYCYGVASMDALSALPAVWPVKEALFSARTGQTIRSTRRPAVLSAKFFLLDHGPDEEFQGLDRLRLFLFLPAGCYASAALHQLLTYLKHSSDATPATSAYRQSR